MPPDQIERPRRRTEGADGADVRLAGEDGFSLGDDDDNPAQPSLLDFLVSGPIDADSASICQLIAGDPIHHHDREAIVSTILEVGRASGGIVDADRVREQLPRWIFPKLLGPVYRALVCAGVLELHDWKVSEDRRGRNSGRPQRRYRLTGKWVR